jgi:hypothetical protein
VRAPIFGTNFFFLACVFRVRRTFTERKQREEISARKKRKKRKKEIFGHKTEFCSRFALLLVFCCHSFFVCSHRQRERSFFVCETTDSRYILYLARRRRLKNHVLRFFCYQSERVYHRGYKFDHPGEEVFHQHERVRLLLSFLALFWVSFYVRIREKEIRSVMYIQ